jgi:predicted CopG family antitoxin
MARVRVADDVWTDFKAVAGDSSMSSVLGELVERDVRRHRERRIRDGSVDDRELIEALNRAEQLHGELSTMVDWLRRRLESR